MSDEASGPEDEDTKDIARWEKRMAEAAGLSDRVCAKLLKSVFPVGDCNRSVINIVMLDLSLALRFLWQ